MTAQAFSISYGSNEANYITGESMRKDHPEKIFRVYDNMLSPHLNASGIWESMKMHVARHSAKHPKLNNMYADYSQPCEGIYKKFQHR